jgi:hypothetical protein
MINILIFHTHTHIYILGGIPKGRQLITETDRAPRFIDSVVNIPSIIYKGEVGSALALKNFFSAVSNTISTTCSTYH